MPLPPSSSTQRSPTKMLERALSSRRNALYADEAAAENDAVAADESKTKKHLPISFFTTRITNYLTRTGPVWPCLLLLALVLLLIFNSRRFVCVSPYDPVSRSGFFGFDGLESDFGSLGVPWCKYIRLESHFCKVVFFSDRLMDLGVVLMSMSISDQGFARVSGFVSLPSIKDVEFFGN
ncbi:uncharacterized protein Pyn_02466 [Prunus yedoensis var. nudiflora]|uniref:Uncharacterized protein n=1 Tax=Prunus yedoensis var. nudiflora TaxID=2094558 RepID=A0A314YV55_PRUYE|nr:uncharacterized protein Pyn_02466 [Prunus yedoensis var. nudiflora]